MEYDPLRGLQYAREQRVKRRAEEEKKQAEEYQHYLEAGGKPKRSLEEEMYVDAEHPSTMENSTATLWYIIIMIVGAIFVDRWLIWIMASFIYFRFITRKERKQKKWDKMQEKKQNKM